MQKIARRSPFEVMPTKWIYFASPAVSGDLIVSVMHCMWSAPSTVERSATRMKNLLRGFFLLSFLTVFFSPTIHYSPVRDIDFFSSFRVRWLNSINFHPWVSFLLLSAGQGRDREINYLNCSNERKFFLILKNKASWGDKSEVGCAFVKLLLIN